jgi:hypothetical protein
LDITNAAPRLVSTSPPNFSVKFGKSLPIPLAGYFVDDDGDLLTIQATFSLSGGSSIAIPSGIFTQLSNEDLLVTSTSISDIGIYTITLIISDLEPKTLTSSFTVEVLNTAPRILSNPPHLSVIHGNTLPIPLSGYFTDDDGDPLTMSVTYSFKGGPSLTVPSVIITQPSDLLL